MPLYNAGASNVIQANDLAQSQRTGNKYLDKEKARLQLYLQQGVARGVISDEQAKSFYAQDDRNWIEKVAGFEASGSHFLQPLIDILSIGNYVSASLAKARTSAILNVKEDDSTWDKMSAYVFKFSPREFIDNFKARTTFGDLLGASGNLSDPTTWGGIAMDVLLDPVTYLTMGVSAGAEVGGKTLTRWGSQVYKAAARELVPDLMDKVAKESAAQVAKNGQPLVHGSQKIMEDMHEQIGKYMVDNYDKLVSKAAKLDERITGRTINRLSLPQAKDMFTESTSLWRKEIGIWNSSKLERELSKITAKSLPVDDLFVKFNQTWGMDAEAKLAWQTTRDSIAYQQNVWQRRIAQLFGDTTEDEAKGITHWIEAQSGNEAARNAAFGILGKPTQRQLALAQGVVDIFDEMVNQEQAVGIMGDQIEHYVTHFVNGKATQKHLILDSARNLIRTPGNSFAKHRLVASIADMQNYFKEGVVLDDIRKIVWARKKASIEMINKKLFYDEMITKFGEASAIINGAKGGLTKPLREFLVNNREPRIVADIDQIWSDPDLNLAKYGFKEGDQRHNRRILKWFTTELDKRNLKIATDEMRVTPRIDPVISFTKNRRDFTFDMHEIIDHVLEGAPLPEKINYGELKSALNKIDQRLRRAGIGPLISLVPDIPNALRNMAPKKAKVDTLIKELSEKFTYNLAAQLPEELVLRARRFRRAAGNITDDIKPGKQSIDKVTKYISSVRFKADEARQLLKAMFNKDTLDSLSAREMDILGDYLAFMHGKKADKWSSVITGEKLSEVTFAAEKHTLDNTNYKDFIKEVDRRIAAVDNDITRYKQALTAIDEQLRTKGLKGKKRLRQTKQQIIETIKRKEIERKVELGRKTIGERQGQRLTGKGSKAYDKVAQRAQDNAAKIGYKYDPVNIARRVNATNPTFPKNYDELLVKVGPDLSEGQRAHWFYNGSTWYLPHSIAELIGEANKKLYAHDLAYIMRGYDRVQNFFKAPLMAPFIEFGKRNVITNVLLNLTKVGISMLNFGHQADFLKVMSYVLAEHTIDVAPLRAAKSGVLPGAVLGGLAGGYAKGEDFDPISAVAGALAGAAGGAVAATGAAATFKAGARVVGQPLGEAANVAASAWRGEKLQKLADSIITLNDGTKYTVAEMAAEAAKRGVFNTRVTEELFKSGAGDAVYFRDLFRAQDLAVDVPTRLQLFILQAKKTGSLHEAGQAVKNYLYDYAGVSSFERRFMIRAIPFYNWTKHALTVSYDSIIDHPGALSAQIKFASSQNAYADVDPADAPDWLSDRLSTIRVNEQTGQMEVSRGLRSLSGIVIEEPIDVFKTLFGGLDQIHSLFARGPFGATSIAEMMLNKDFFTGREIRHTAKTDSAFASAYPWREAPEFLKNAVGYRVIEGKESVDPQIAWLLQEIPYSRFITTLKNVEQTEEGDINYFSLSRQIFGEKLYKYDTASGKLYEDRAKLNKMAMFLKNYRLLRTVNVNAPTIQQPSKMHKKAFQF